jgi:hypothetical protein
MLGTWPSARNVGLLVEWFLVTDTSQCTSTVRATYFVRVVSGPDVFNAIQSVFLFT